jgi:hypothetical protein
VDYIIGITSLVLYQVDRRALFEQREDLRPRADPLRCRQFACIDRDGDAKGDELQSLLDI